jgi:hypothetical protein
MQILLADLCHNACFGQKKESLFPQALLTRGTWVEQAGQVVKVGFQEALLHKTLPSCVAQRNVWEAGLQE